MLPGYQIQVVRCISSLWSVRLYICLRQLLFDKVTNLWGPWACARLACPWWLLQSTFRVWISTSNITFISLQFMEHIQQGKNLMPKLRHIIVTMIIPLNNFMSIQKILRLELAPNWWHIWSVWSDNKILEADKQKYYMSLKESLQQTHLLAM